MAKGLNVGRLVNVSINLSPLAVARRGFGILMILGDSDVIQKDERVRSYTTVEDVANDFGVKAPEYFAAQLYFAQTPTPKNLMIGRQIAEPSGALLTGGILSDVEKQVAEWQSITDGALVFALNSVEKKIENLDFTDASNLNAVAEKINAKAGDNFGVKVLFDGDKFLIKSTSGGSNIVLGYATAAGTGTDLSAKMRLTKELCLNKIDGSDAESLLDAVLDCADKSAAWYGLAFATSKDLTQGAVLDVAKYVESATPSRILGVTETNMNVLSSLSTDDLASNLKKLNLRRTFCTFSQNKYSVCSIFGRAFTVDFNANKSTITLMYKQEPSVVAETLTETQAGVLKSKNCNVFVNYANGSAIIQYGTMANGTFLDEVHGLDWLVDAIQTELYNLLYQSKTKVPQTDEGQNQLINTCNSVCAEGVRNGLIASGIWNAEGFGQLNKGDYLTDGYYVYSEPIAFQAQSIREQRIAPPLQIAVKLAGAIHTVDATIEVNR